MSVQKKVTEEKKQAKEKNQVKEKVGIYELVQNFTYDRPSLIQSVREKLSECKRLFGNQFKCSLRTVKEKDNKVEIERFKHVNACGLNVPIYVDCNEYTVFDSLKNDERVLDGRHKFAVEQAINFYDGAVMNTFFRGKSVQRQKPCMFSFLVHVFSLLETSCTVLIETRRRNEERREKENERKEALKKSILYKQERMKNGETVEEYTREERDYLTEQMFTRACKEMHLPDVETRPLDPLVLPITFYCRSGIYESLTCSTIFYHVFKALGLDSYLVDYASHQLCTDDNKYGRYPTKIYHERLSALVASYQDYRREKNKKATRDDLEEGEGEAIEEEEVDRVEEEEAYDREEMDIEE